VTTQREHGRGDTSRSINDAPGELRNNPRTCRVCGSWAERDLCVSCAVDRAELRDEPTSLEMLADYECPECGSFVDELTEDEATAIFGGDENGVMRCPHDWCDEELTLTPEAAADNIAWAMERIREGQSGGTTAADHAAHGDTERAE